MHGKYRIRTMLRGALPWTLAQRIPKGVDCHAHEFYRQSVELDACYHCQVTRPHQPTQPTEQELLTLERAARAGSHAALEAIDARIQEGTAHVVPAEPVAH
jgi:hypothetical protein